MIADRPIQALDRQQSRTACAASQRGQSGLHVDGISGNGESVTPRFIKKPRWRRIQGAALQEGAALQAMHQCDLSHRPALGDVVSGLVRTVIMTPAKVGDVTEVDKLLHGQEKTVYAVAGYQRAEKRAPKRARTWYIAAKRASVKAMPEGELKEAVQHTEHIKAAVRAKVGHPFRVVKCQIGYQKERFKRLLKNTAQILTLFALSNLWMVRRMLLASAGDVRL